MASTPDYKIINGVAHVTMTVPMRASNLAELIAFYSGSDVPGVADIVAGPNPVDELITQAVGALQSRLDDAHDAVGYAEGIDEVVTDIDGLLAVAEADDRSPDQRRLDEACAHVTGRVPGAQSLDLATSDQNMYGFVLADVRTDDGELSDLDPGLLAQLQDELDGHLNDLSWYGAVGEDSHGDANIPIRR